MPSATRPARCAGTSTSPPARRAKWNSRFRSSSVPPSGPCRPPQRATPPLASLARGVERHLGSASSARVRVQIGGEEPACVQTLRTATGHILVNRDGPALQPGPRRYTRSWIRDGATMSAALLRMGCADEVRDFLAWYAPHQAADGNVPCAVDRNGPDWLPEHDSHGQLVFTLAEYFRFTGDRAFAAALWPAAQRAIGYLESLRATRRTPEFRTPERRALLRHPARVGEPRGLSRAAGPRLLGRLLGAARPRRRASELAQRARRRGARRRACATLRDELRACLYAVDRRDDRRARPRLRPGLGRMGRLRSHRDRHRDRHDRRRRAPAARPRSAGPSTSTSRGLRRRRRGEIDWNNYTAYEIRILGALVRLGRRADAHELLEFFLADRRPRAWNQWPEISWRDPRSPGHLGDVPHAWIGAEYVLAVLGMFAYERPGDAALVHRRRRLRRVARRRRSRVEGLPTWWGPLGYSLRREGTRALRIDLAPGLTMPPGGVVISAPLCARPLVRVEVDGEPLEAFGADEARLSRWPGSVVLRF